MISDMLSVNYYVPVICCERALPTKLQLEIHKGEIVKHKI